MIKMASRIDLHRYQGYFSQIQASSIRLLYHWRSYTSDDQAKTTFQSAHMIFSTGDIGDHLRYTPTKHLKIVGIAPYSPC